MDFLRYADGPVNHWYKIEHPGMLLENGHVVHVTFAVLDVPKDEGQSDDMHGSEIIVVPLDGVAPDRDLEPEKSITVIQWTTFDIWAILSDVTMNCRA